MSRQYYSSRNNPKELRLTGLCQKFVHLYMMLRGKDYFKEETGDSDSTLPEETKHKAALALDFQPYPITEWDERKLTEDNLFDVIEYLYDHVSKPMEMVYMETDSGWNYMDYEGYDKEEGKREYRGYVNAFLNRYRNGYELSRGGQILSIGSHGIQSIISTDLPAFGNENIDLKVQEAILKWRNRHLNIEDRRNAIKDLADVYEWLQKSDLLSSVLNKKDESILFEIVNNFAIRHHNPKQIQNYDKSIWYSWMFHFYLATFHAVSRMINKKQGD